MPAAPPPAPPAPLALPLQRLQEARALREAGPAHGVPGPVMAARYARLAEPGGLLVAEACWLRAAGHEDGAAPGLYSADQVNAWRQVTDAVHAAGGLVLAQIGQLPADAAPDLHASLRRVRDAAEYAGDAGFDGVELSGRLASVLLPANGGEGERLLLLLDLVHTLSGVWPVERVGVCLPADAPLVSVRAVVETGVAYVRLEGSSPG